MTPKSMVKHLLSLRVTLTSAKLPWVRDFCQGGKGPGQINVILDKTLNRYKTGASRTNDLDEDILLECVRSLRVLMNIQPGFTAVLTSPELISKIAYCLHTGNDRLRMMAADLLAALCIVAEAGQGRQLVLDAMTDFQTYYAERFRFEYLVESLVEKASQRGETFFTDSNNPMAAFDYKTSALTLINAMISSAINLSDRIALREEFWRRGLQGVVKSLRINAPPGLLTQLDIHEEDTEEDQKEAEQSGLVKQSRFVAVAQDSEPLPSPVSMSTAVEVSSTAQIEPSSTPPSGAEVCHSHLTRT